MSRPIILSIAIFFAGSQIFAAETEAPSGTTPVVVESGTPIPLYPVVVQPEPEPAVTNPGDQIRVAAAAPAGPIFGAPTGPAAPAGPLEDIAPGGTMSPWMGLPSGPEAIVGVPNPLAVPVADEEFTWDQIADVVSDYFTISSEQRVRRLGSVWTEGRIETAPLSGATVLEPHRGDSVGMFNRWESTFQTIRRWAVVRVVPDSSGYLVDVEVHKELEDMPRPELATAAVATFRNDGSLPSRRLEQVSHTRSAPRWIPLGRDPALEQRMLADIQVRLGSSATLPVEAIAPQTYGPQPAPGLQPAPGSPWQLPPGWAPPPGAESDCAVPGSIEIYPEMIESDCSAQPLFLDGFPEYPEYSEGDSQSP